VANEENPDGDKASWTIKSVPVEVRKLAVACAAKQDQTMAEWLERAVRNQANLEAGERILPPIVVRPSAVAAVPGSPGPAVPHDMAALADLMQAAQAMAEAAEVALPKATARHALALLTAQLRAARGLPTKQPRQTRHENGQTIEAEVKFAHGQTESENRQTVDNDA
jgi:hypothetical protein